MDKFSGFMVFASMLGASGGVAGQFIESKARDFGKCDILSYCLFPSVENDMDASLVSPYNFVMNYNEFLENANTVVAFSNH